MKPGPMCAADGCCGGRGGAQCEAALWLSKSRISFGLSGLSDFSSECIACAGLPLLPFALDRSSWPSPTGPGDIKPAPLELSEPIGDILLSLD